MWTPSGTLLEKAGQIKAIVASAGLVIISVLAIVSLAVGHIRLFVVDVPVAMPLSGWCCSPELVFSDVLVG